MPNPARGATWIPFRLESAGRVSLELHDVAGRRVREIFVGDQGSGEHRIELDTSGLPAGVYWYRLESAGRQVAKQCIVLK